MLAIIISQRIRLSAIFFSDSDFDNLVIQWQKDSLTLLLPPPLW